MLLKNRKRTDDYRVYIEKIKKISDIKCEKQVDV